MRVQVNYDDGLVTLYTNVVNVVDFGYIKTHANSAFNILRYGTAGKLETVDPTREDAEITSISVMSEGD